MIDWVQGDNWILVGTDNIRPDYGGFHVYAFTMTLGMIFAVLYSFYKFWKRGIPIDALGWGVIFIIPASLFGASFFGKLNADGPGVNAGDVGFWGLFAFWKAGMAIHGGVFAGLIVGLIIFSILGRKPRVSVWLYMDAIIPNILLGQIVGRWGNFFNHEVVGAPLFKVGHVDNIPLVNGFGFIDFHKLGIDGYKGPFDWLWKNTMAVYTGNGNDGLGYNYGDVVQMSPIFLIESLSLLLVWLIVTFIIPNLGKWFGPKPWNKHPNQYKVSWDWTFKHFFMPWKKDPMRKTYKQVWDESFVRNVDEQAKADFELKVATLQQANLNKIKKRWQIGRILNRANNPDRYWITKTGCEAGAYFFGWNLVRFILEMSRPDDHLFIMYNKTLSLWLIGLSAFVGLVGMVLTQISIPELFRKPGWMYEKDYFETEAWVFKNKNNGSKQKRAKVHRHVNIEKQQVKEDKALKKLKKIEEKNK